MNKQVIVTPSGERMVVLPEGEYLALIEAFEDREDAEAVRKFEERLAVGEEELVSDAAVARILNGENKVRVWREYRGLTGIELAERAGISSAYLSQIEGGTRDGSFDTMKKIAAALDIAIDDLA